MVLCAFGPGASHRYFVSVTHDSRVRLFDTASGAVVVEAVEQGHLSITYTSMAWAHTKAPSISSAKRKRGVGDHEESPGVLALGTKQGHIVLFDLALGKAVKTLSGHASAVTSLVFGSGHDVLFSGASGDKEVVQWNTGSGKRVSSINVGKRGASCLTLSADGSRLAAASSSIRMFDVASTEKMQKFTGYATKLRDARFSRCGNFLFSIAPERFSSVFHCSDASIGKGNDSGDALKPVHNFSMPTVPSTMDFQESEAQNLTEETSESTVFHFLTTTEDGAMYVWRWNSGSTGKDSGRRKSKEKKRTKSKRGDAIEAQTQVFEGRARSNEKAVCARFAGNRIIVAAGEATSPVFRMVDYLDMSYDDGRILSHIDINGAISATAASTGGNMVGASGQMEDFSVKRRNGDGTYIGSALAEGAMVPSWPEPSKKRIRSASGEADEEDDDEDDEDEDDGDDSQDDVSLVERVQALEEQLEMSITVNHDDVADKNNYPEVVRNKGSLVRVLEQALHANDDALLEHCLGTTDNRVVDATVSGLTPRHVIPFLNRVVAKFEARPARGKLLTVWIQSVIEKHASYIVSTPSVLKTLSGLNESIDARLGAFKRLLKLSGRLDLVLSQMSALSAARGESDAVSLAMQDPVSRFVDTEE